ncbi:12110_t:CDS:2 [Gigaspora rosea]|nr:12110_t:CDS:2 [Gigaspora rosea]
MTAATSSPFLDVNRPTLGDSRKRSRSLQPPSFNASRIRSVSPQPISSNRGRSVSPQPLSYRKHQDSTKKIVDQILGIFLHSQRTGRDDNRTTEIILDTIKKFNCDAAKVLNWLSHNQNKLEYKTLLGYFYLHDIGTEIDTRKAYNLYLAAAKKDYPIAQYLLGECKDSHKAFTNYKKAMKQGNVVGMHFLGDCYEKGTGVQKNIDQAIYYYSKAAELGYEGSRFVLNKLLKVTNSSSPSKAAGENSP